MLQLVTGWARILENGSWEGYHLQLWQPSQIQQVGLTL
jgi:hypothetical protein